MPTRSILLAACIALAAIAAAAQTTHVQFSRHGGPHFEVAHAGTALDRVSELLELTESQVVALEALIEGRRDDTEALREALEGRREALESAVSTGDPAVVGAAYLEMRAAGDRLEERGRQFEEEFDALLTTGQRELKETIERAGAGAVFGMLGLDGSGAVFFSGEGFEVTHRRWRLAP